MLTSNIRRHYCATCYNTDTVKLAVPICVVEIPPTPAPCSNCGKPALEITHREVLADWIGDFSQSVYECSYNEEDVREAWRNGHLDQTVKDYEVGNEISFRERLGSFYREDGQYQAALTSLVKAAGGWAAELDYTKPLSSLTTEEQQLVDAFEKTT